MSKTIFFIRHAKSQAKTTAVSRPNAAIDLNDKGRRQAQNIAANFNFRATKVYVSEFIRTYQTAAPYLDKHQLPCAKLALLNEFNPFGTRGLTGAQRKLLNRQYWLAPNPHNRADPSGQTFNEFNAQVQAFINLMPQLEHNSLLFGHGTFLSLLAWQLLGFYQPQLTAKTMGLFANYSAGLPAPNTVCYAIYNAQTPQKAYLKYITAFNKVTAPKP